MTNKAACGSYTHCESSFCDFSGLGAYIFEWNFLNFEEDWER